MLGVAWLNSSCDPGGCGSSAECGGRDWLGFATCACPSGMWGEPEKWVLFADTGDYEDIEYGLCWRCPENMTSLIGPNGLKDCVCDEESVPWSWSDGLMTFSIGRRRVSATREHRRRSGSKNYDSFYDYYTKISLDPSECLRCTAGRITGPSGTQECSCPQGSVWRLDDECRPCPDGTTTREAGSKVCGCPTGHIFAANGSCTSCPVGTTTKWPASDVCDVGISVGMHWALAAFLSILCALCPVIVTRWLHFSWPMSFDVAVSSIDFGSDFFWVLTDPFYDEATLVCGFVFLFGTSLAFILAFYVRGLPGVIRSWWFGGKESIKLIDIAESHLPWLCLPIHLPLLVGDTAFRALRGFLQFDLMGWMKQTKPMRMLQEGWARLVKRGIFQVYETIDGELLYVLANIAVTLLLVLVLGVGWAVCACVISMSLLLWGAVGWITGCCFALLMACMFVVGLIATLAYIAWGVAKGAVSLIFILGLICLGILLNMTRLLAARPVSRWYGALWVKAQDNPLVAVETLQHPPKSPLVTGLVL